MKDQYGNELKVGMNIVGIYNGVLQFGVIVAFTKSKVKMKRFDDSFVNMFMPNKCAVLPTVREIDK